MKFTVVMLVYSKFTYPGKICAKIAFLNWPRLLQVFFFFILISSGNVFSQVKVYEGTEVIPTYKLGKEEVNPIFYTGRRVQRPVFSVGHSRNFFE